MRALFMVIAVVNVYMFLFIAGRAEFGDGRPILAGAFFVLAVMWGIEFALDIKSKKEEKSSKGDQLKERLQGSAGPRTKR